MAPIVDSQELGRRIRKLRLERRMTLKQVEHACGLSATHLSEIERGRTSPTIGALVRIARALQKEASFFIEYDEREDVAHRLREQVTHFDAAPGVSAESLAPGIPGSSLYAYRLRFDPRHAGVLLMPSQELAGEAIYYVRSGAVSAKIGDSTTKVGAGDALQGSLAHEHQLSLEGAEAAEVMLLCTRPLEEAR